MAGFRDLADRLAELKKVPARAAKAAAASIQELVRDEFPSSKNAYDNAWAPLLPQTIRRKRGDARILRATDKLSSSPVVRPASGSGITIEIDEVGRFHQAGTKYMVARKILPDGTALPKAWQDAIAEAIDDAMKVKKL